MEFYPEFIQNNSLRPMKKIKVEPSSLHNDIKWKVEPKPILVIKIPKEYGVKFDDMTILEKQINEAGWFLIYLETNDTEVMIQSFTLKDSQEVQVQELKQIILNEIKGK